MNDNRREQEQALEQASHEASAAEERESQLRASLEAARQTLAEAEAAFVAEPDNAEAWAAVRDAREEPQRLELLLRAASAQLEKARDKRSNAQRAAEIAELEELRSDLELEAVLAAFEPAKKAYAKRLASVLASVADLKGAQAVIDAKLGRAKELAAAHNLPAPPKPAVSADMVARYVATTTEGNSHDVAAHWLRPAADRGEKLRGELASIRFGHDMDPGVISIRADEASPEDVAAWLADGSFDERFEEIEAKREERRVAAANRAAAMTAGASLDA